MRNLLDYLFNKINVLPIIGEHVRTIQNYRTGKLDVPGIFLFFILPIPISFFIQYSLNFEIQDTAISLLTTALSVFAALLFNFLLLVIDFTIKEKEKESFNSDRPHDRYKLLTELNSNISFAILISIFSLVFLLLIFLGFGPDWFQTAISLIIHYLVINFIFTLFMILKRTHTIISVQIN